MNDDYDKEILDENTTNLQSQKNLTYEFSTLHKVTTEEEDAMSSLGSLKLRSVNRLIFGQININSIRNKFELLFSLILNNIDVLLISKTKIDNRFPVSQFCAPLIYELCICYMLRNIYLVELKLVCLKFKWLLVCSYNQHFYI